MKKILSIISLFFFCNSKSNAQKFYDIVGHARNLISNAIADADRSANYTVNHTTNELNVLVATASQLFGDQMDKQVGQLKESSRKIAEKIMELSNKIESGQGTLIHLEDNLSLDLNNLLGNIPFIDKEFVMKRATGFNHLYKGDGEYQFVLTGSNFGFNTDKVRVTFTKISLENNDITESVNLNQNIDINTKKIGIKASTLNRYFNSKKLEPIKVSFEIKKEEYSGFFSKRWKETARIQNSIYLYLFPNYSGQFTFDIVQERFDWQPDGDVSINRTGPNAHCSSDCQNWYGIPVDFELSVSGGNTPAKLGDYKLSSPEIKQTDGPGGFDADIYAKIVNCNEQNDNCTKIIGHFRARTRPTTYILSAKKWKYTINGIENRSEKKEFEYNKIYKLNYPKSVKSIIVSGIGMGDGQNFSYNITQTNSIFELISLDEINGELVYQFKIKRPSSM